MTSDRHTRPGSGSTPSRHRPVRRKPAQRGIALVTTVWVSLFLALTAATVVTHARNDASARRNAADLIRARELARAGLQIAIHEVSLAPAERTLPRDGRQATFELDGNAVSVAIEDERGKLDLRQAQPQFISALFRAEAARQGIDAFDAVNLAQAASKALEPPPGQERLSRLHSMSGLVSLPNMPPRLVPALERHATLFGFSAQVNPSTASRETLLAIDGVTPQIADAIIAARERGQPRPSAGQGETSFTTLEGPVYTVRAVGRLANGVEASATAVVGSSGIGLSSKRAFVSILELR